jgi:hypothetical protein
MEIRIEERSDEIVFFLKSKTVSEAAQLIRVVTSVIGDASGYVNYSNDNIMGWVSVPLAINKKISATSGVKERRVR